MREQDLNRKKKTTFKAESCEGFWHENVKCVYITRQKGVCVSCVRADEAEYASSRKLMKVPAWLF